jgi:hypothetical protein
VQKPPPGGRDPAGPCLWRCGGALTGRLTRRAWPSPASPPAQTARRGLQTLGAMVYALSKAGWAAVLADRGRRSPDREGPAAHEACTEGEGGPPRDAPGAGSTAPVAPGRASPVQQRAAGAPPSPRPPPRAGVLGDPELPLELPPADPAAAAPGGSGAAAARPAAWAAAGGEPPAAWLGAALAPRLSALLAALREEARRHHRGALARVAHTHARLLAVSGHGGASLRDPAATGCGGPCGEPVGV